MPTTNYIWDEENLLAETDGSNVVQTVYTNEPRQYGNLISTRISGTTSYHHFDAIGSTRQLTNSAGSTTDTMIYDAWGNVVNRTGTTAANLLWNGELGYYSDPEIGQFYVRRRPYKPVIARWTTVDPLGHVADPNSYRYAGNNGLTLADPSGLFVSSAAEANILCATVKARRNAPLPPPAPATLVNQQLKSCEDAWKWQAENNNCIKQLLASLDQARCRYKIVCKCCPRKFNLGSWSNSQETLTLCLGDKWNANLAGTMFHELTHALQSCGVKRNQPVYSQTNDCAYSIAIEMQAYYFEGECGVGLPEPEAIFEDCFGRALYSSCGSRCAPGDITPQLFQEIRNWWKTGKSGISIKLPVFADQMGPVRGNVVEVAPCPTIANAAQFPGPGDGTFACCQ